MSIYSQPPSAGGRLPRNIDTIVAGMDTNWYQEYSHGELLANPAREELFPLYLFAINSTLIETKAHIP